MKMRKLCLVLLIEAMLSANLAFAGVEWRTEMNSFGSGSYKLRDSLEGINLAADVTENVRAISVFSDPDWDKMHNFTGNLLFKNGRRNGFAGRGKYILNLPILNQEKNGLWLETALAGGFLEEALLQNGQKRFQRDQFLYGGGEYLKFRLENSAHSFTIKIGGEKAMSQLIDDYGKKTFWDNSSFLIQNKVRSKFSDWLSLRFDGDARRTKYNPEIYFFTEKRTEEVSLRSELVIAPLERLEINPLFNYKKVNIERDGRVDLEKREMGGTVILKEPADFKANIFLKGVYAPWLHKNGEERLISGGIVSKNFSLELYQKITKNRFSTFTLEDRVTGLEVSWKFGNQKDKNLRDLDSYAYAKDRKYEFYRDSGIKDDSRLTLKEQAERLRTLRKRNEWSGHNLSLKSAPDDGWGFRNANEVYKERGGDCDEQSCHNSFMDTLNGYKSFELNYYDYDLWEGHGVQLVQDPTNGQWFLDEYGAIYKIKVDPNAPIEKVALEGLKQNHTFLALQILRNGKDMYYQVYDCSSPFKYDSISKFISLSGVAPNYGRPQVEYGSELFTGRNFLLGD
ncbi:MAG: hypothetical protein Q7S73_01175 [bacterium]|nr:hypothetical protein [bacterium]